MKKIPQKLLILIIILNFMGMVLECTTAADNSKTTIINNSMEKDRLEKMKEKEIITVTTPLEDITYFYMDAERNNITGIDADIITEIAKRLGINKVEIKEVVFSNLLEKLNSDDNVDIAAGGIYITPKREEIATFTQPLYKGSEAIVVQNFSKINFKTDLINSVVGVEEGTIFVKLVEKWKEDNMIKDIVIFKNSSDLLNAVNSKAIDAGVVDSVIVKYSLLKDKNLFVRILKNYTPEVSGTVGIAVRKNDTILLDALNEKINEMKADGALYAILVENGLDRSNMIVD